MTVPTHSDLVQVAAKWLSNKYPVVVTEITTVTNEQPDAIGFQAWGKTALIECKASHLDFKSDAKKIFRMHPYLGMGSLRWYLCPTDVIQPSELPQGWGLLYFNGKRVSEIVKPVHFDARNFIAENMVLLSTIRRISVPEMKGISIKVYTTETKCRASLFVNTEKEPIK
jgi:hypothetical protein